jgi:hypothetical protein
VRTACCACGGGNVGGTSSGPVPTSPEPEPEPEPSLAQRSVAQVKSHRFLAASGSSLMSEFAELGETDEVLVEGNNAQDEL